MEVGETVVMGKRLGGLVISLDSKEPFPQPLPLTLQRQPELCLVNEIQKKKSEVGGSLRALEIKGERKSWVSSKELMFHSMID